METKKDKILESLYEREQFLALLSFMERYLKEEKHNSTFSWLYFLHDCKKYLVDKSDFGRDFLDSKFDALFEKVMADLESPDFRDCLSDIESLANHYLYSPSTLTNVIDEKCFVRIIRQLNLGFSLELRLTMQFLFDNGEEILLLLTTEELSGLSPKKLRYWFEKAKEKNNLVLGNMICNLLVQRMPAPLWEFQYLGAYCEKRSKFKQALEFFKKFLSASVKSGKDRPILLAANKVSEMILMACPTEDNIKELLNCIPENFRNDQMLQKNIGRIRELIEFRAVFKSSGYNSDMDVALGTTMYTPEDLHERAEKLSVFLKFHPNAKSYYELSKTLAALGRIEESKEFLLRANQSNIFMFQR